jgi:hypothetical protein
MWSNELGLQMNSAGDYESQSPQLGSGRRLLPLISEIELDDNFEEKMTFMIEKLHFPHPSVKEFLSAQLLEQVCRYIHTYRR